MSRLSQLSNRELTIELNRLVTGERARAVDILEHLNEVWCRELHLERGFGSFIDYCMNELKYSRSAAGRRIAAARVLRVVPEAAEMLAAGDVSVTTLAMVARLVTPANGVALLERIRGCSERAVEHLVAAYRPGTVTRDRVRRVSVREPVNSGADAPEEATPGTGGGDPAPNTSSAGRSFDGKPGTGATSDASGRPDNALLSPPPTRVVHKHRFQFVASDDFRRLFDECKAILSNRAPDLSMETIFAAAMNAYLDRHCPTRRRARRERRRTARVSSSPADERPLPKVRDRHIPIAVRDAVFARDGGRCTFVAPSGVRCDRTEHLHLDHIVPFSFGGSHDPSNLRLLCRPHNLMAARHALGRGKMAEYTQRE